MTLKVENEIKRLFKEDRIDLTKRKHVILFKKIHEELLYKTEHLLVTNLMKQINSSTKRIGYFAII